MWVCKYDTNKKCKKVFGDLSCANCSDSPIRLIEIPAGATNGDVIMSLFPKTIIIEFYTDYVYIRSDDIGTSLAIKKEWWNAPYEGSEADVD